MYFVCDVCINVDICYKPYSLIPDNFVCGALCFVLVSNTYVRVFICLSVCTWYYADRYRSWLYRYGQSHRCNGPNFRSQKWTRDND